MHSTSYTHLIRRRVVRAEGLHSPGSCGVIAGACDVEDPRRHRLPRHALDVSPSGVLRPCVVPHGVVSSLQRLDTPTQKNLQQIYAGDSPSDDIYKRIDQRLDMDLLRLRERELLRRSRSV